MFQTFEIEELMNMGERNLVPSSLSVPPHRKRLTVRASSFSTKRG
jgi:hypothetical protein